ncbi:hypothetical protein EW146_g8309 [Bondarzewia mesenterica]|uniref:Uncharacterized protein n=1 Tax=Bondarzewia mesenterica TaxID=1095465 RepID=A0A4S4LH87_9AGAM|nr:hypothetical protein EW146_g8309 [Bondarzewia mesenterica]
MQWTLFEGIEMEGQLEQQNLKEQEYKDMDVVMDDKRNHEASALKKASRNAGKKPEGPNQALLKSGVGCVLLVQQAEVTAAMGGKVLKRKAASDNLRHHASRGEWALSKKAKAYHRSGMVPNWRTLIREGEEEELVPTEIEDHNANEIDNFSEDDDAAHPKIARQKGRSFINTLAALEDVFSDTLPYDSDMPSMFDNGGLPSDEDDTAEAAVQPTSTIKNKVRRVAEITRTDDNFELAIVPMEVERIKPVARRAIPVSFKVQPKVRAAARRLDLQDAKVNSSVGTQVAVASVARCGTLQKVTPSTMPLLPAHLAKFWGNEDLPEGCQPRWKDVFIPQWIDFMGMLEDPWNTDLADKAQLLWNQVFPDINWVVKLKGEPVFGVNTNQIIKRIYQWHVSFSTDALEAVDKFFNAHIDTLLTADERAAFTAYAAPQEDAAVIPFIWGDIDQDPMGEHETHFQIIQAIPKRDKVQANPIGAVAMASAAAERALSLWRTGVFVKPKLTVDGHFSKRNWGQNTEEYVGALKSKTENGWRKLTAHAIEILEDEGRPIRISPQGNEYASGSGARLMRANCVDVDSEPDVLD